MMSNFTYLFQEFIAYLLRKYATEDLNSTLAHNLLMFI
jgi:hypothetical protein